METLVRLNIELLTDLESHLTKMDNELYAKPMKSLSYSSIGQHIRHVLEFYLAITEAVDSGFLCYDDRRRNEALQTHRGQALLVIQEVNSNLEKINVEQELNLSANYSTKDDGGVRMTTSLSRELAYGMDHAIHHMAIIKSTLENNGVKLSGSFGLAPSTYRYNKKTCVQ